VTCSARWRAHQTRSKLARPKRSAFSINAVRWERPLRIFDDGVGSVLSNLSRTKIGHYRFLFFQGSSSPELNRSGRCEKCSASKFGVAFDASMIPILDDRVVDVDLTTGLQSLFQECVAPREICRGSNRVTTGAVRRFSLEDRQHQDSVSVIDSVREWACSHNQKIGTGVLCTVARAGVQPNLWR